MFKKEKWTRPWCTCRPTAATLFPDATKWMGASGRGASRFFPPPPRDDPTHGKRPVMLNWTNEPRVFFSTLSLENFYFKVLVGLEGVYYSSNRWTDGKVFNKKNKRSILQSFSLSFFFFLSTRMNIYKIRREINKTRFQLYRWMLMAAWRDELNNTLYALATTDAYSRFSTLDDYLYAHHLSYLQNILYLLLLLLLLLRNCILYLGGVATLGRKPKMSIHFSVCTFSGGKKIYKYILQRWTFCGKKPNEIIL